jgi:uncharacterized membrane protein YuzA (DUF378 family)
MRWILYVATILVIVGGLNWGLVGAFDYNLVAKIFGDRTAAARTVSVLVGISALIAIAHLVPRRARGRADERRAVMRD